MFAELAKVMDYAVSDDSYLESLQQNIAGKTTRSNQDKTTTYLRRLYSFDMTSSDFRCFKYFWEIAEGTDRPLIAFLYACSRDFLLNESVDSVLPTPIGEKVTIEKLEAAIETLHPDRYSDKTRRSLAQNIASSWKQAGYIEGKVKNIRVPTSPSYTAVAFATLLAYLTGSRGEYLLTSQSVRVLAINKDEIRAMLFEAAKRDLLQYQNVGHVTTVSFKNLFRRLGIDGIED
jgi:hypothetical protein